MVGNRAKRGFLNEAADDIQAITGVKRNAARDLARGNKAALKELTAGKRRRVERVGAERTSRLHQLELTRRKPKKSVESFEKDIHPKFTDEGGAGKYGSAVEKWKKVLENETADDIRKITGASRESARNLARGNQAALGKLTVGNRRRVGSVRT